MAKLDSFKRCGYCKKDFTEPPVYRDQINKRGAFCCQEHLELYLKEHPDKQMVLADNCQCQENNIEPQQTNIVSVTEDVNTNNEVEETVLEDVIQKPVSPILQMRERLADEYVKTSVNYIIKIAIPNSTSLSDKQKIISMCDEIIQNCNTNYEILAQFLQDKYNDLKKPFYSKVFNGTQHALSYLGAIIRNNLSNYTPKYQTKYYFIDSNPDSMKPTEYSTPRVITPLNELF